MGHRNVCCDGCGRTNFTGRRYKCLRCGNYDLCGNCYDNGIVTLDHLSEHPMQLILDRALRELHFAGESFDEIHLPNCYTCPYCGATGYTAKRFIDHVITEHRHTDGFVICPMCAVMPNIDVLEMRNLWRHLQHMHTQHANLLDPLGPTLRRPVNAARLSRRTRRRIGATAAVVSMFSSTGSTASADVAGVGQGGEVNVDNTLAINRSGEAEPALDILFQITESRRSVRPEVTLSLPPDGCRVSVEGFELLEERIDAETVPNTKTAPVYGPVYNSSGTTDCASTVSINGTCTVDEPMTLSPTNANNNCEQNYLLPTLMSQLAKEQKSTIDLDMMRLKRAHFVEQLVISALMHNKLMLPGETCSDKKEKFIDSIALKQSINSSSDFQISLDNDEITTKQKID